MLGDWFRQWLTARWRDRVAGRAHALPHSHAQGVEWLLAQLNDALRDGNPARVANLSERLARFLAESALAHERAAAAQASCFPLPASLPPASGALSQAETLRAPAVPLLTDGPGQTSQIYRYDISSTTLAEAHAYLTQRLPGRRTEPEFMLAVTGIEVDGVRTLERLIEVKMDHQSFGQASFDMGAFTKIALALYEHDQHLHAVFHSHRFGGVPAPSGTDTRLQDILEEAYPAIQAVFSEDGYVRFFANKRRFAIEIHGTGVRPVDGHPNTFRIVQFSTLPHPAIAAAARGRGDGVRPL